MFDLSQFHGRSYFEDNRAQNYLVFQPFSTLNFLLTAVQLQSESLKVCEKKILNLLH